jgi:VWFA-related protein
VIARRTRRRQECRRGALSACATIALGTVLAVAQTGEVRIRSSIYAPPNLTLSVQSKLVEVAVTVKDGPGRPAAGLQATDFEVLDQGTPREIQFFSERSAAPAVEPADAKETGPPAGVVQPATVPASKCTIALFFDDTHAQLYDFGKSKEAAQKLIRGGLRPGDRLGVFTDSGTVTEDFTTDSAALLAAIARIQIHLQSGFTPTAGCPQMTAYEAYAIKEHIDYQLKQRKVAEAIPCDCPSGDPECIKDVPAHVQEIAGTLWDQSRHRSIAVLDVLQIVIRHLASQPGDRMLVLISPGFVTGGMERQIGSLVDASVRSRIVVSALDAEGVVVNERQSGIRQQVVTSLMSTLSSATGGEFIHNTNDLGGGVKTLVTAPEVSYLLGFSPPGEPDNKYHALKVRLKRVGNYHIQARSGYYFAAPVETIQERLDRQAIATGTDDGIPAGVRISKSHRTDGKVTLRVAIHLDAKALKFASRSGRHVQQLTFVTLLEDSQGNYVAGKQSVMDLALTSATLTNFRNNGFGATVSFSVPKGSYQVREVIREAVQNRMSVSNTPVDVP